MILRMFSRNGLKLLVAYGSNTAVTSSNALISKAMAPPGVKAFTTNWSIRKPTASPTAVVNGTPPRTARLATAISHSARVSREDTAKMTAYCFRKPGEVRSIFVVFWISSSILRRNQMFASVSFCSRNPRGVLGEVDRRLRLADHRDVAEGGWPRPTARRRTR